MRRYYLVVSIYVFGLLIFSTLLYNKVVQTPDTVEVIASNPNEYAYVLFASSDTHACAVMTLVKRLKSFTDSRPVDYRVTVSKAVSKGMINRLSSAGIVVDLRTDISIVRNQYFANAMLKLESFSMVQYRRVIHLDADVWVMKSLDHLFDLPSVTLAAPVANWENEFCISGAMLVIQPSTKEWDKIKEKSVEYASVGKTEMNLLNELYEHKINRGSYFLRILPNILVLPCRYMILSTELKDSLTL
jgi:hypothetical protein